MVPLFSIRMELPAELASSFPENVRLRRPARDQVRIILVRILGFLRWTNFATCQGAGVEGFLCTAAQRRARLLDTLDGQSVCLQGQVSIEMNIKISELLELIWPYHLCETVLCGT